MTTSAVVPEQQEKSIAQLADEKSAQQTLADPFDFLQTFKNAPSKATIESWKAQAPNGTVRMLALGKRVYIVRGISGLELMTIQNNIPDNLGASLSPEARQQKVEQEISLNVASRCVVWTSSTPDGKLTVEQLRGGSAGLPSTLFALITYMSDFIEPDAFSILSAEL